jgi:hypothetical protein
MTKTASNSNDETVKLKLECAKKLRDVTAEDYVAIF